MNKRPNSAMTTGWMTYDGASWYANNRTSLCREYLAEVFPICDTDKWPYTPPNQLRFTIKPRPTSMTAKVTVERFDFYGGVFETRLNGYSVVGSIGKLLLRAFNGKIPKHIYVECEYR